MTTCLYFDNLKCNIFGVMVYGVCLSCTAYWKISTCTLTPRCKADFYFSDFYLCVPLH